MALSLVVFVSLSFVLLIFVNSKQYTTLLCPVLLPFVPHQWLLTASFLIILIFLYVLIHLRFFECVVMILLEIY